MRTESWCGYDIRFVEVNGEWWAVLKDICEALDIFNIHFVVRNTISDELIKRIKVDDDWELVTNELGIYELIFKSDSLEANKFKRWSASVMQKLRRQVGLEPYEAMRMTEPEIQEDIDHILDTLFYDDEKKMLMQSVTVAGGDVEQIPFE